jgi:FKBP-type peptidyl-prolyl cis-trans isomerase
MKPTIALLCAALAAASLTQAQEVKPAQPAEAPPADGPVPMDKVSYFIGKTFATQLSQEKDLTLNMQEFTQGVKDTMNGAKSRSYMLGTGLGDQFHNMNVAIDVDKLAAGINFTLDKAKTPDAKAAYSEEELTAAMQLFENSMRAKQKAKNSVSKDKGDKFLAENGKKKGVTTTKSGLQYEVIKEGTGAKPAVTDTVKVHYHGTLIDGKVFDSSVERGEPVSFPLQQVIKGWTEGLQLMPVGSKWRFFIPSDLAYGEDSPSPDIGPNETLIFDVELLGIVKDQGTPPAK